MIERGHAFVWCNEAVVYEVVPPVRWRRTFMLRRALLRGKVSPLDPTFGSRDIVSTPRRRPRLRRAAAVSPWCSGSTGSWHASSASSITWAGCSRWWGMNPVRDPYVTD